MGPPIGRGLGYDPSDVLNGQTYHHHLVIDFICRTCRRLIVSAAVANPIRIGTCTTAYFVDATHFEKTAHAYDGM